VKTFRVAKTVRIVNEHLNLHVYVRELNINNEGKYMMQLSTNSIYERLV